MKRIRLKSATKKATTRVWPLSSKRKRKKSNLLARSATTLQLRVETLWGRSTMHPTSARIEAVDSDPETMVDVVLGVTNI